MSYRVERIIMPWVADFNGRGEMVLELTDADQDDPRVLAIVEMWREREREKVAAAGLTGEAGNPFPAG